MDSTAMGPPPTATPHTLGVYAPPRALWFPSGSTPTFADYADGMNSFIPPMGHSRGGPSHSFTPSYAWSTGAHTICI